MTTAIVVKGYPRLSETFIAQEIEALERSGLDIVIVSLRHPTDKDVHPVHRRIKAPVFYLPEYLLREPLRVWRAWQAVRKWPAYKNAKLVWLSDLRRDLTSNRIRRFGQALVLAHEMADTVERLYAHFLHTPSSVARYASILRELPWSAAAHAVDIWTTPEWELREKLADAAWVTTCTAANRDRLQALSPDPSKVSLNYHGLDVARFETDGMIPSERKGDKATDPVVILSVGRLVPKKGYDDLLAALAKLPRTLHWRFIHVGGGPLKDRLTQQARGLGIDGNIDWLGAQSQEKVLDQYRRADLFVLTSRIAKNGDRDGLPNVLMEAQSVGLPCVSTRASAIPELIVDGETGFLVEPGDIEGIERHLAQLIGDPALRHQFGKAGQQYVRAHFDFKHCVGGIRKLFGLKDGAADTQVA